MYSVVASTLKIVSAELKASITIMILTLLKLCNVICGKAFIDVKVPLAYSVKLQFDLHLCPVFISAAATLYWVNWIVYLVGLLPLLNVLWSVCCSTVLAGIMTKCLINMLIVNPLDMAVKIRAKNRNLSCFLCELTPVFGSEQDDLWCGCLILILVRFVSIETCRGKYGNEQ